MRTVRLRLLVLLTALALGGGCAQSLRGTPGSPVVVEHIYFGRFVGDSLGVSDSSWTAFLAEVVTPRFPDGLTVWRAEGQWRGADGTLVREPSFVLELVHPGSTEPERAVTGIIEEYKRRFRQEAVLRLRLNGRATY